MTDNQHTSVFYESVHRIEKTMESLVQTIKEDRKVVIAREMTKLFEEVVRGTAGEVQKHFIDNKDHLRGEFVVIVEGKK